MNEPLVQGLGSITVKVKEESSVGFKKEGDSKNISFFPNPSNNYLEIKFSKELLNRKVSYSVYNHFGSIMQTGEFDTSEKFILDVSSYPAGVYILNLKKSDNYYLRNRFSVAR